MASRRLTRIEILLLLCGVAGGLFLRSIDLADRRLDVDEAESTINALTILERGYPSESYMGLPIYENTLSTPWPESEEYEFRDSSYSKEGVAVYHAWLPLYAIAAALKLAGIEPDPPTAELKPRHGMDEAAFRTTVPRLPSLLFSAIFMLAMFGLGRAAGGPAAGWTVLILAAFSQIAVELGAPARYYSATLAMSALSGWMLWRLMERGRARDGIALGGSMMLLFHCHVLSCFVLGVVALGVLPVLLRRPGFWRWALPCGGLFLAGTLPWIFVTGFPGDGGDMAKAWTVMELPGDLIPVSGQSPAQILILVLAGLGTLAILGFSRSLPTWLVQPAAQHGRALILFFFWGLAAFLAFSFLIPLVSYFPARVSMMLVTPKLLFTATVIAAALSALGRRLGVWVAPAGGLALLMATGSFADIRKQHWLEYSDLPFLAEYFENEDFEPGTRLYAEPSQQLVLAYTLGLPAQSIAPVRKSFLDSHPGEIVFLAYPAFALGWDAARVLAVLAAAQANGSWTAPAPTVEEAAAIAEAVRTAEVRASIAAAGAVVLGPEPVAVPEPIAAERARELAIPVFAWWTGVPIFFGFDVRDHAFAWKVFFYRFVDPVSRSGAGANFASRIRGARAQILSPAGTVVYRAPL